MRIFRDQAAPLQPADSASFVGPAFTKLFASDEAGTPVHVYRVEFRDGARTNWHTHPLGQTLHVVTGAGRAQVWGGPIQEIKAGDTVWIPPGEKHWHGAAQTTRMAHVAIHEALDGKHIDWLEPVTDAQYGG